MARKRTCFASSVCCSDSFLDLPAEAQALYLHLGFAADADGAVDGIRSILRMTGFTNDDLAALVDSGYLVDADGVLFIAHWWVNNTKNARDYRPGDHQNTLSLLTLGDDRIYRVSEGKPLDVQGTYEVNRIESNCIQGESKGKEKNSKQINSNESNPKPAPAREASSSKNAPCPSCGIERAIANDGLKESGWHGWCPQHGDFFINAEGEYK